MCENLSAFFLRGTEAVSSVKTHRNNWAGDTSLVGVDMGLDPILNQIILIILV